MWKQERDRASSGCVSVSWNSPNWDRSYAHLEKTKGTSWCYMRWTSLSEKIVDFFLRYVYSNYNQDLIWAIILFWEFKHTKKLFNRAPIQPMMNEGLSFLSHEPSNVWAPHLLPTSPFSLSTKLTNGTISIIYDNI